TADKVYKNILHFPNTPASPVDALQSIVNQTLPNVASDVMSASAAGYEGAKVAFDIPATQSLPALHSEIWLLILPAGQLAILLPTAEAAYWNRGGNEILHAMIASLKINLAHTNSASPTSTIVPSQSGATLTPTHRPTSEAGGIIPLPLLPGQ